MIDPGRRRPPAPPRARYLAPRFFLDLAELPARELRRLHAATSHALEHRTGERPGERTIDDGRRVASSLRVEVSALAVELTEQEAPAAPPSSAAPPPAPAGALDLFPPRPLFSLPWGAAVLPRPPDGHDFVNVSAHIAEYSPDVLFSGYREYGFDYGRAARQVVTDLHRLGRLVVTPPLAAIEAARASTHRTHEGKRLPPRLMVRDGGQLGWCVLGKRSTYELFDARGRSLGTARQVRGLIEWRDQFGWYNL